MEVSMAAVDALVLTDDERAGLADEYAHVAQLIAQEQTEGGA
jgi:hypothetical protein